MAAKKAAKKAATKVRTPKSASEILSQLESFIDQLNTTSVVEVELEDITSAIQSAGEAEDGDELRGTVDDMDPSNLLRAAQENVAVLQKAAAFYKANRERLINMLSAESFIECPHCNHSFNKDLL